MITSTLVATLVSLTSAPVGVSQLPADSLLRQIPGDSAGFLSVDLSQNSSSMRALAPLIQVFGKELFRQAVGGLVDSAGLPKPLADSLKANANLKVAAYFIGPVNPANPFDHMVALIGLKPRAYLNFSHVEGLTQSEVAGRTVYHFRQAAFAVLPGSIMICTNDAQLSQALKRATATGAGEPSRFLKRFTGWINPNAMLAGYFNGPPSPGAGNLSSLGFSLDLGAKGLSLDLGPAKFAIPGYTPDFSKLRPLPLNYSRNLPSGPYLFTAMANPWAFIRSLGDDEETIAEGAAQAKGALSGNLILGLYPTRKIGGRLVGLDLLAEVLPTGPHASDAASAVRQIRRDMEKKFKKEGGSLTSGLTIPGADGAFQLNSTASAMLRAPLRAVLNSTDVHQYLVEKGIPVDSLVNGKTLAVATVGRNVFLSTSALTLARAVKAFHSQGPTLADDPEFHDVATDNSIPTAMAIAVAPSRILPLIPLDQWGAGDVTNQLAPALDVPSLLRSWPGPLYIRLSGSESGVGGHIFMPINFKSFLPLLKMIQGVQPVKLLLQPHGVGARKV